MLISLWLRLFPLLALPLFLALSILLGWLLAGALRQLPTHSFLERLLLYWLLGVTVFSWVGTLLAAVGLFRPWAVGGVLLLLVGWRQWTLRRAPSPVAVEPLSRTPLAAQVLALLLLAGAGWLVARPAEAFFLFDDSAVYTLGGIVMARSGAPWAESHPFWLNWQVLPSGAWEERVSFDEAMQAGAAFMRQFTFLSNLPTRHYGPFYQWSLMQQTLEIGFLPLPKAWMALATWLGGPANAPWSTPFLGLTGLAAFYGLSRRLRGWGTGVAGLLLLMVSVPQIWFSRYPISEIYAQGLLLAALYLLVLLRRHAPGGATPVLLLSSALAFAALALTRFEGVLVLGALAVLLALAWGQGRESLPSWARRWLILAGGASALGLAVSLAVARYYMFSQTLGTLGPQLTQVALGGVIVVALGALLLWQHGASWGQRVRVALGWVARQVAWGIAAGWALWAAVALVQLLMRPWGESLPGWLAQYWTRPGLAMSILGALWLCWEMRRHGKGAEGLALLGLAVLFLLGFSVRNYTAPMHPWAMRRLVPVVLPALALGAASFLVLSLRLAQSLLARWLPRSRLAQGVATLLIVALALLQAFTIAQRSLPILIHRERQGLWTQLEQLSAQLPAGAVVLFDDGPLARGLTQVLELVFDHPALVIQNIPSSDGTLGAVDRVVETALAEQRAVYLLRTGGEISWYPRRWQLRSLGARTLSTPLLRQVWGRPPYAEDIATQFIPLDIYEVLPPVAATTASPTAPWRATPGPGSFPALASGFYPWEMGDQGRPFAWTKGEATLLAPWPAATPTTAAEACLRLSLAGGRPEGEAAAQLVVEAEGQILYTAELPKSFGVQTLTLPLRALANRGRDTLEIRLRCNAWDAAPGSSGNDQRKLGILLYSVEVLPTGCP